MSKCVKCGNKILTGDIYWEMGLCNNCYNELYKDHKTHISLDKMWLELAQSFRDENEKLQDKIADLEAKLAESEKNVEFYQERYSDATTSAYGADLIAKNIQSRLEEEIRELKQQLAQCEADRKFEQEKKDIAMKRVSELKQQLAEKDAEIEQWKSMAERSSNLLDKFNRTGEIGAQDKISFAVEQLEKAIKNIKKCNYKDFGIIYQSDAIAVIDNQIRQLKEGK